MSELRYRYIEPQDGMDENSRSLNVAFATETPVLRVGMKGDTLVRDGEEFYEVLSHDPAHVDLSKLNDSGAFLDEHDVKRQLGKVKSARVDTDKVSRAEVVYDSHALAEERYGQMKTRHRPHISTGYRWNAIVGKDRSQDGLPIYRFSWTPDEISSVAIPADRKAGVGRSEVDSKEKAENEKSKTQKFMAEKTEVVIDENKIRSEERDKTKTIVIADERKRTSEISTIADALIKDHGKKNGGKMAEQIRGMVAKAIATDESVADFKVRCMQDVLSATPAKPTLMEDVTDADGAQRYSLLRGIQSCLNRKSQIPDGLEGEVHQEIMRRSGNNLGYEATGFQVPSNAPMRASLSGNSRRRDMQAAIFASGGAFVPTNLITPIIELLRNKSILDKVGIRTMAGLTGNIIIPRQEASATAYAVSEIGALTASQQILGQIALSPKRVGAQQLYSKQFVMQSSPDAEAFLRDDLFKVIALQWDRLGLNGQGAASEPLGMMNTPGIQSILFGGTVTYAKIVAMETALRAANVTGDLAYVSTPTVRGALKTSAVALTGATTIGGTANAIWVGGEDDAEVNSCSAYGTNQVPNNQVILGDFSQLIHALWGGLDVVVDQFTKAGNAETVITINTWGDIAVRHPQAFCVSADAGNQ